MIYRIAKCFECGKRVQEKDEKKIQEKIFSGKCPRCNVAMKWMSNSIYIRVLGTTRCFPSLKQAKQEHAKVVTNAAEGKSFLNKGKKVTWEEGKKRLLQEIEERNQPRTYDFYEGRLKTLSSFFSDDKILSKISREDIDDYVTKRLRKVSKTSVNRELATLRRLLLFAKQRKWIFENPLEGYEMFEERERERVLTEKEEEKLYKVCREKDRPAHLYPIVLTARDTMLRRTDVLTLKIREIDFEEGVIRKKVVKQRKGKEKVIEIPLTARLRDVLKAWVKNRKVLSHYLFPSPDDNKKPMLTSSKFGFETAVSDAGLKDVHFHDLRRTGATRWAERGGNMKVLQEILNHSDINITAKIYTRVSKSFKKQEMEKVEGQHGRTS